MSFGTMKAKTLFTNESNGMVLGPHFQGLNDIR